MQNRGDEGQVEYRVGEIKEGCMTGGMQTCFVEIQILPEKKFAIQKENHILFINLTNLKVNFL